MCTRNSFTLYFLLHKFSRSIDYSDESKLWKKKLKEAFKVFVKIVFSLWFPHFWMSNESKRSMVIAFEYSWIDLACLVIRLICIRYVIAHPLMRQAHQGWGGCIHSIHLIKKMKTFLKIKTFGKAKHELRSLSLEKGCVLCTKKIECSNPRWKVAPNSTDISSEE